MDSYDQAGMMSGEIVVDGEWRELRLWGFKIKNQGNIQVDVCEEDHHIGFLENGDMYHLIRTSKYGAKNGIYYGSVYAPSCEMRSIDYVGKKSKHELKAECGQLHVRGGDYTISVSTKRVPPEVVFYHGHRSCGVVIAAIDLKSENYKGCGLSIVLKRSQQSICSLPGYIKHKIIQEHDLSGSSPLVSDIHNECSKMPDLTGGKGSSLAVLHSIAKEVKTFSVPRGFIVTTTSYKLFSSNEVFRKLMREMEASMTGDDWQKAMKDACTKMVGAVERLSMPTDIKEAISEHLTNFDKDKMFAVRSSALGEDSEDMSAAGQMTTLLGIRGTEDVINAVVKCWASQFSFPNVNYKR
nr:uncharacterized protein LOC119177845 [Rhipicephalus microplus]